MRGKFLAALFTTVGLCAYTAADAGEIRIKIDSSTTVSAAVDWEPSADGRTGTWIVQDNNPNDGLEDTFSWGHDSSGQGGAIKLSGTLDADPVIAFGLTVTDVGAPSNFSFSFIMPLIPTVSGPSTVFDSLSGSVVNGAGSTVTITPLLPPVADDNDGPDDNELQVFTLSSDGGSTWQNVGLDQGPAATYSGMITGQTATYGPFTAGPIPTIAGGPWTHMRADINFGLSGFGDSLTLTGAKVLVPEPGALAVVALALGIGSLIGRRNP